MPARAPGQQLESVVGVSKSDAWTVGSLLERWNGRKWSAVPGARTGKCGVYLEGVAARAASSAWAAGYCGRGPAQSARG